MRIKLVSLVVIAAFLLLATGCIKDEDTGKLWEPFVFRSGDYFKYSMIDHASGKQGWASVQMRAIDDGRLEAQWEGELDGERFSVTTTGSPARLVEFSRPDLIIKPATTPFLNSVLSMWWEKLKGFSWRVGANWSVVLDEMMPASFNVKVEGRCSVAGKDGFSSRFVAGGTTDMMEGCTSPDISMPLRAKTYKIDGEPQFEAWLEEYRRAQ